VEEAGRGVGRLGAEGGTQSWKRGSIEVRQRSIGRLDDHKLNDKNVNHFTILISHSTTKYIGNMKWFTKIING
jgi:hypothetical protein